MGVPKYKAPKTISDANRVKDSEKEADKHKVSELRKEINERLKDKETLKKAAQIIEQLIKTS